MEPTPLAPWQSHALALLMDASEDIALGSAHAVAVVEVYVDEDGEAGYRYRATMGPNVPPQLMLDQVKKAVSGEIGPDEIQVIGALN